jgi:hypothetical protein
VPPELLNPVAGGFSGPPVMRADSAALDRVIRHESNGANA